MSTKHCQYRHNCSDIVAYACQWTFTLGVQKGVWSIVFMTLVSKVSTSKCRVRVMLCLHLIEQMNTDEKSRLNWGCMLLLENYWGCNCTPCSYSTACVIVETHSHCQYTSNNYKPVCTWVP